MNLSLVDQLLLKDFFSGVPVKKAYLFGSRARNEANESSDFDILVELDHSKPIGMKFFTYQSELALLLKKKVDLVSSDGLSPHISPIIEIEKVLIYERDYKYFRS